VSGSYSLPLATALGRCCGVARATTARVRPSTYDRRVPHELLALTSAEWIALAGLAATMIVGIAAAFAPTFTAKATREHEVELERAKRLYAQRHGAYLELARFLARQRLTLERTERAMQFEGDPPAPDPLEDEAWMDMRARWTTLASADVRKALTLAGERYGDFANAVLAARAFDAIAVGDDGPTLPEVRAKVDEAREAAVDAIEAAEDAMNTELAEL
jgi:hypothetical protein